jgi:hypothetical protein
LKSALDVSALPSYVVALTCIAFKSLHTHPRGWKAYRERARSFVEKMDVVMRLENVEPMIVKFCHPFGVDYSVATIRGYPVFASADSGENLQPPATFSNPSGVASGSPLEPLLRRPAAQPARDSSS